MAISVMCPACFWTGALEVKVCKKCGKSLHTDRKYRVMVKVGHRWRTKRVDSLDLARKVEATFKADAIKTGELGIVKAPVIDEVWKSLHALNKANLKAPGYHEKNWQNHIRPVFSGRRLDTITSSDMDAFSLMLQTKPRMLSPLESKKKVVGTLAPATVCGILKTMKRLYRFAEQRGLFQGRNPTRFIALPKFDNQRTNVLTREEMTRLAAVLSDWPNRLVALAFRMLLASGKRAGEVFGLTWDRVDFESDTVTFITKSRVKGKRQVLPMNRTVRATLLEAREEQTVKGCGLVFHTSTGKRIQYAPMWSRIRAKAGIRDDFRPHDLRHTFASYLASSGEVDIYTLKNLLGHETIQMTQRYSHLMDGALKKAVEVADQVLGGVTPSDKTDREEHTDTK